VDEIMKRFTYWAFAYTLFSKMGSIKEFIMKRNICVNAELKDVGGGFCRLFPQQNY
jgi:hypothetical protein